MWYSGVVAENYSRNPNTKCKVCCKEIYRRPCQIKENEGNVFCSLLCRGINDRKEKPCIICKKPIMSSLHKKTCCRSCSNINRAGIKYKIGSPKDKVKSQTSLKIRLLKLRRTKCERCNYEKKEILQVHHKDRNRENNDLNNLELICPNCHYEEHIFKKIQN